MCAAAFTAAVATAAPVRFERAVRPGGPGANRLDVDVELLSGAKRGLEDLRLFDSNLREVGYLLIAPPEKGAQWIAGDVLPVASTKTTSGFEVDLRGAREVDRLRLNGIPSPYLKPVRVEGSGDRAHWTLLADATLFDLPDQNLRRNDVAFEPGRYRYLRVTWDDRASARVQHTPLAEARVHGSGGPPEPLRFSVPFRPAAREPGKSRYRIDLPGQSLPLDAIELVIASGDVFRTATVSEPRLTDSEIIPVPLGSARLRRAQRDGGVAADLAVPIHRPSGRELVLTIDDDDNPPLPVVAIVARAEPQPWIYYESPDGQPLTARFGDERLTAPRYDIEASRPFASRAAVQRSSWGASSRRTPEPAAAAASSLTPLGAAVEPAKFRHSRPLTAAPAGLSVLRLDADVLSRSRDLADVRIVDSAARQVPYVVERRDEPLEVPLKIAPREEPRRNVSVYKIQLPFETLPAGTRLVLRTGARVFERSVTLWSAEDDRAGRERRSLAEASWRHNDGEIAPPPLVFDVPLSGTNRVELEIDEGDNAPLPIASAELLLRSYALRFQNPGGPLRLIYGNREATPPRYDLALIAPRLFAEQARDVSIASAPASSPDGVPSKERKIFWIVIAAAVVVLGVLLARLLRSGV
jgi:hypothetical protein